ncbi:CDP-diacylglycerol--serine O-phosphatidyltransferase [uncultured Propionivibrio sp.]|uniref:CDP-diacylglycerol--serine O-phosphatidyltransferase n=1 Tax=uncultured Propionivibrio sp. TaxID=426737 RepID=UPI0029BFDDAF|nr:CDP-diacylglycerol--serine O-phosphatidyltransferase [uncultured Propionivibrio sp.]
MEHDELYRTPTSRLASVLKRWRDRARHLPALEEIRGMVVPADAISILPDPAAFRETLLAQIANARKRILIAALYLQDDDAGREILAALYAARAAHPEIEIAVFVDWHRAQRGLIGKKKSAGNAALYRAEAERLGPGVTVYGVPVQRRELLGVLHLKGFVFDDTVLYSGASLNDVYLQRHGRYRLDRYHLIQHRELADCMARLLTETIVPHPAVHALDKPDTPATARLKPAIADLRRTLAAARYRFNAATPADSDVSITPLIGLGLRHNELNRVLLQLVLQARSQLTLFTPYFNLPGSLQRALRRAIRAGCRITIVLGDKTANDFYIPPTEPFKTIGALPYLYEANLRRFCKRHQRAIATGMLNVHIWKDGDNTFHLKGMIADEERILLTGNNLNPRAWRLDLENGLLIHDPNHLLAGQHQSELDRILTNTVRLARYDALETVDHYPPPVQRLIRRLARIRADRLINQML